MNKNHTPNTKKFAHMLSDINDHYEMRTRFTDEGSVQFNIWFDNLRYDLHTTVMNSGDIGSGLLDAIIDGTITTREELESCLPEWADLRNYSDNGENTKAYNI